MSVRRNALLTHKQRPNTSLHIDKVNRITSVVLFAGVLLSLSVLARPTLAQSAPTTEAISQLDPPISSLGDSRNQSVSSDVISVSHLRIPEKAAKHLEAAQKSFAAMQLAQAAKEIDRAIKVYPAFAQAFCMKALVQLAGEDSTGSVESAAHAISLDDTDAYSWIALATAFNSLDEWPEAEAAAGRALLLDSLAWQARLEMAKSLYGEGKYRLAINVLDQLRQDIPDIHLVRANSLMRLGRTRDAARQFSIFLEEAPADSRAERIRQILAQVEAAQN